MPSGIAIWSGFQTVTCRLAHDWANWSPFCYRFAMVGIGRVQKRKASIAGGQTIQRWAMRDVRVRLRRPLPLRASDPRVLRWKTLTRFLSSAPWRVRIPMRWALTRKAPIAGGLSNQVVGDEGCRVRLRRPLSLRRFAPRVLRWKTLTRFLSFAPWRVRIPMRWALTRKAPIAGGLSNQVVGDEGFEPPALCV